MDDVIDDGIYEFCMVCGQEDAMYVGNGDFICDSTDTMYNVW